MTELYYAALAGNLGRVTLLVEQGVDKNQVGGNYGDTALSAAADNNCFAVMQYLVEQGADMNKHNTKGANLAPLHYASSRGHLEVVRYLLEQGAERDKADTYGRTPLHLAADSGHLETVKLLMVYGADLDAGTKWGQLPVDIAANEEVKQAIRDEPRRRIDEAPGKRCTVDDRLPDAALPASVQQKKEEAEEQSKLPAEVKDLDGKIAEEDEDSEPSDEEDEK